MAISLSLENREVQGKHLKALRESGMIPMVIYGGETPILAAGKYNDVEKVLHEAGYHSPVELDIAGKKQLAIVKNIDINAVNRRIMNVEFQAISASEVVEATTPIRIDNFDGSEAAKKHFVIMQVLEEIDIKAKPADLPEVLVVDGGNLAGTEDKITIADLKLPKGVELANKELETSTVIANVYDPAAEAAAREAEDAAATEAPAEEAPAAEEAKAE